MVPNQTSVQVEVQNHSSNMKHKSLCLGPLHISATIRLLKSEIVLEAFQKSTLVKGKNTVKNSPSLIDSVQQLS